MTDPTGYDRELDVREIDGEPFEDIMAALDELGPDERLLLINSFEPAPLFGVMEKRGYTYESEQVADDEWHIGIREET